MMNAANNHHVLTPVPGDPSGRLVMTLLPSQGHDLMHDPHHHSGASHTSSSHSTRYNHPGELSFSCLDLEDCLSVGLILLARQVNKKIKEAENKKDNEKERSSTLIVSAEFPSFLSPLLLLLLLLMLLMLLAF